MNRKEARDLLARITPPGGGGKRYNELHPWQRVPTCNRCADLAVRRICRDGEFLCEDHAEERMDKLCDLYGSASSCGARRPWERWLRSFYWRPYFWLTRKGGPYSAFMIRRAWYRWIFGDQANA